MANIEITRHRELWGDVELISGIDFKEEGGKYKNLYVIAPRDNTFLLLDDLKNLRELCQVNSEVLQQKLPRALEEAKTPEAVKATNKYWGEELLPVIVLPFSLHSPDNAGDLKLEDSEVNSRIGEILVTRQAVVDTLKIWNTNSRIIATSLGPVSTDLGAGRKITLLSEKTDLVASVLEESRNKANLRIMEVIQEYLGRENMSEFAKIALHLVGVWSSDLTNYDQGINIFRNDSLKKVLEPFVMNGPLTPNFVNWVERFAACFHAVDGAGLVQVAKLALVEDMLEKTAKIKCIPPEGVKKNGAEKLIVAISPFPLNDQDFTTALKNPNVVTYFPKTAFLYGGESQPKNRTLQFLRPKI